MRHPITATVDDPRASARCSATAPGLDQLRRAVRALRGAGARGGDQPAPTSSTRRRAALHEDGLRAIWARAARSGVAVVPAMGFDYVPGDMLASLTAEGAWGSSPNLDATAGGASHPARVPPRRPRGHAHHDPEWSHVGIDQGPEAAPDLGPLSPSRSGAGESAPVGEQGRRAAPHPDAERPCGDERLPSLRPAEAGLRRCHAPGRLAMRTPLKRLAGVVDLEATGGAHPEQRGGNPLVIVCEAKRGEVERGA